MRGSKVAKHLITGAKRHSIDVGISGPMPPGTEFDDSDVPEHMKENLNQLIEEGAVIKGTVAQQQKKAEGS
jgi:hypothetical protein